ncbi:transposase [Staphylococcus phage Stau2]|uniref:Transposase n=1 Tax=Staphylococcus phage Stau2 TaxID=1200862 RepID=A0A0U1ZW95_9CAUD|nr:transposase [Staphylococcus phage Stau2]AKA61272.1 transposase [Staphylococcus phage Stau2]
MSEEKYKRINIRLLPTKEQEELMWKSVNNVRFIKNYFIARCYEEKDKGTFINLSLEKDFKKELTYITKLNEYKWLTESDRHSKVVAIKDVLNGFVRYYKGIAGKPKFRKRGLTPNTFSVRNDVMPSGLCRFRRDGNTFKVSVIGYIKYSKRSFNNFKHIFDIIEDKDKFYSPVIRHDGKYWYISLLYKDNLVTNQKPRELTDEIIGIDLGLRTLMTCSNGIKVRNINLDRKVLILEKRERRLQKQVFRKYDMNKQGNKYVKTKNIIKLERKIRHIRRKLKSIRNNHIHTETKKIVEMLPKEIVIEDLHVKEMLKDKWRRHEIQYAKFFAIRQILSYKCKDRGILLTIANRWYPSSQLCSNCETRVTGKQKTTIKSGYHTFKCKNCNHNLDRDLNASINLKNYRYSNWYRNNIIEKQQ